MKKTRELIVREFTDEAIWVHTKLLNNVVINYKPPLRSWAHPCCFPLQYAADDVCDYKLVLGTWSVLEEGTAIDKFNPTWFNHSFTVWHLCQYFLKSSKTINLPRCCDGVVVYRSVLMSWFWYIIACIQWLC
jgi:hypothetical protein